MIFAGFWRAVLISWRSTTVSVSRSLNPPENPHHPQSLSLQLTASVLTSALQITALAALHTARNRTKSSFYYHSLSPSVCEGVCVCTCERLCAGEVMTDHIFKLNWDLHLCTLPQGFFQSSVQNPSVIYLFMPPKSLSYEWKQKWLHFCFFCFFEILMVFYIKCCLLYNMSVWF